MIHISGNAANDWYDEGVECKVSYAAANSCGYQKLLTRNLSRNRDLGRVDYQLIYVVSGRGFFHIGGDTVEVKSGQVVLYAPHQPQRYSYYAQDAPEVYWIHYSGYGVRDHQEQLGLLDRPVHDVGLSEEAVQSFKKIIHELNMKQPASRQLAAAYLLELLALLGRRLRCAEDRPFAEPHADIHHMIAVMHERYADHVTVKDLARQCSLSPYRFIHKFKAVTGTTPMKYVTLIRIQEAKKLLAETSLHISEVAAIVGYDNPLYFSRVFCQAVGMPPSSYKRQAQHPITAE